MEVFPSTDRYVGYRLSIPLPTSGLANYYSSGNSDLFRYVKVPFIFKSLSYVYVGLILYEYVMGVGEQYMGSESESVSFSH